MKLRMIPLLCGVAVWASMFPLMIYSIWAKDQDKWNPLREDWPGRVMMTLFLAGLFLLILGFACIAPWREMLR